MSKDPDLRRLCKLETGERNEAMASLLSNTAKGATLLLSLLNDSDWSIRWEALEVLRRVGGALARVAAQAALNDERSAVRGEAAKTLGEVGCRADVRRLAERLEEDRSWVVRSDAALSLGSIGGPRAFAALSSRLSRDPNEVVRRDCADAISQLGEPSIPVLEAALKKEKHELVRAAVLYGLYRAGRRSYLGQFVQMLGSEDVLVRCNVINIIDVDEVAAEHRLQVITAVRSALEVETNPGIVSDGNALLERLQLLESGGA